MALREHTGSAGQAVRYGRHSRPRPIGGRLRLPTIRFSGAAMAMSTVVGISIATTWLLNEQQGVGRNPGVSNVGASPPLPSPDSPPSTAAAPALAARTDAASPGTPASPRTRPTPHPSGSGRTLADPRPGTSRAPAPSGSPTTSGPVGLRPVGTGGGSGSGAPTRPGRPVGDALSGQARVEAFGPSGLRHTVVLTVRRPLTALQVELRLERPATLPGTAPVCSMPGVVTTVSVERGTLVYRYTLPAGADLAPGRYSFEVLGARPARTDAAPAGPAETWSAAAFLLDDPQAVAVRGTFG
ncbi:hypothetical protein [Kitasatospora sp. NPDC059571]|uniref:hypothetical protein n=1 Tax=Kitasatospora sp. NPDC059571 TaxID=3346871 RepID=UPI0036C6F442